MYNVTMPVGTTLTLANGTTVSLSAGTTVSLNNGTTVGLTAGTTVGLSAGTSVSLASGSTVGAIVTQGVTLLNAAPTVSAANTLATVSLTGASGQRITIRGIYVKATGAAASSTLLVQDGGSTILDLGTISVPLGGVTVAFTGNPLVTGSTGNNMTVLIGAGGVLSVTTTSIVADRQ